MQRAVVLGRRGDPDVVAPQLRRLEREQGRELFGDVGLADGGPGLDARCPGAASEPVPDGSTPFVPPDSPNLCDPGQTPKP